MDHLTKFDRFIENMHPDAPAGMRDALIVVCDTFDGCCRAVESSTGKHDAKAAADLTRLVLEHWAKSRP